MARDPRYKNIKDLIESGKINSFDEIFENKLLPKTVLAADLGMHHTTLNKLIRRPQGYTFELAFHVASLFDVDKTRIVNLITNQCLKQEKGKKRARPGG